MPQIPLLSPVALVVDLPDRGLSRGEMGTVVEHLGWNDDRAVLVEFADDQGQTYAMAELRPEQLLVLHRRFQAA
ncbi:MAG TPA: DUF4926 domain-containing protein [Bryobacteraceae bacterium]|jgi:hypothetical protein